jgi:hypothetical protein
MVGGFDDPEFYGRPSEKCNGAQSEMRGESFRCTEYDSIVAHLDQHQTVLELIRAQIGSWWRTRTHHGYADEKLAASAAVDPAERSVVLRESLQALIERDAARRLTRFGGSDPGASAAPRRRSTPVRVGRRAAP